MRWCNALVALLVCLYKPIVLMPFVTLPTCTCRWECTHRRPQMVRRNLVDPASSHMLVSKIKPCMSQYKLLYGETANGSLKQL
jgi:hypothetical protein